MYSDMHNNIGYWPILDIFSHLLALVDIEYLVLLAHFFLFSQSYLQHYYRYTCSPIEHLQSYTA